MAYQVNCVINSSKWGTIVTNEENEENVKNIAIERIANISGKSKESVKVKSITKLKIWGK